MFVLMGQLMPRPPHGSLRLSAEPGHLIHTSEMAQPNRWAISEATLA